MTVSPIKLYADRAAQPISLLTTELNSLANNAVSTVSAAIDNDAGLDLYVDLEGFFTFGTNPTAGSTLDLYFVRQVDGTNYEDTGVTSGLVRPANGYVGSFILQATTSAQRLVVPQVLVPPLDFKVLLYNNATGQSLAASANTVKGYFYHLGVG